MNALTRIPVVVVEEAAAPVALDLSLPGAVAAIALWVLLHAALVVSWLSAGRV